MQVTVVDLLTNMTVTVTTVYANSSTLIGPITSNDTVHCVHPLLPRNTNVTIGINTVLGRHSCAIVANMRASTGWVGYYLVTLTANNNSPIAFNLTGAGNGQNNVTTSIALSVGH